MTEVVSQPKTEQDDPETGTNGHHNGDVSTQRTSTKEPVTATSPE